MGRCTIKKRITALKKSIAVWKEKLSKLEEMYVYHRDDDISFGRYSCPLCLYQKDLCHVTSSCAGCPVSDYTGIDDCENTPYTKAAKRYGVFVAGMTEASAEKNKRNFKKARRAFKEEIRFLKKLKRIEQNIL